MPISREIRDFIDRRVNARTDRRIKELLKELLEELLGDLLYPKLPYYVFPGGKRPIRSSDGAIGFDFFLRAVLSPHEMDPKNPVLRKTLFDFKRDPIDALDTEGYVERKGKELIYRLEPGESVLVGVGCVIEMPFPMFHWIAPRSGLASKWRITVTNSPGTIDPDYRGEAGVIIHNIGKTSKKLRRHMKIAQGIFQWAVIPTLVEVKSHSQLTTTKRGAGGFGSTGLR